VSHDPRTFYDALAPDYDAIFADWPASVARQGALLADLLADAPDPILDVACGMGTQTLGSRGPGGASSGGTSARAWSRAPGPRRPAPASRSSSRRATCATPDRRTPVASGP